MPAQDHFGFAPISPDARQGAVNDVFARVARRYDLMNDVMSGGLHRLWKDDFAGEVGATARHGVRLIDVAGGTGDIAGRVLRRSPPSSAVMLDISAEMLGAGREKLGLRFAGRLDFVQGDAQALPFPDASFDAYTIAFGIRNVTDIAAALAEARRVLRLGGRFLCLEFSAVDVPGLDALYEAWSLRAIPRLGRLLAGDEAAYRYLVESIRRFPRQEAFSLMIAEAGLSRVKHRNLSGGIAAIHSAWAI